MKKKRGYTIIEMLLVFALVTLVTSTVIISYELLSNNQKKKDYENMLENIKTASELYLKNDTAYKINLDNLKVINLPVTNLVSEGFLDEYYTTNPQNKESIINYCIQISLGELGEYMFGEFEECGSFLVLNPNPMIVYSKDVDLMYGVLPFDKDGNKKDVTEVTVGAFNPNDLKPDEAKIVKYTYDGKTYERGIIFKVIKTEINTGSGNKEYEATVSGIYKITAYGAQGDGNGGRGGKIIGYLNLNTNDKIDVVIGTSKGVNGGGNSTLYKGGGATVVKLNDTVILAAAGGGGGSKGTNGGLGTGLGADCSTNFDKTITCSKGSNGDTLGLGKNIGGGGASGEYRSCTELDVKWDSCATGTNTCKEGYVQDTTVCTLYKSCSSCSCSSYGTKYSSCAYTYSECVGGYVQGSCASWNYSYSGKCSCRMQSGQIPADNISCNSSAYRSGCNSYCKSSGYYNGTGSCSRNQSSCKSYNQVWNSCVSTRQVCEGGYVTDYSNCVTRNRCSSCPCETYGTKLVPCATGSNTCQGASVPDPENCKTLKEKEHNSGQGGSNYISSTVLNYENASNELLGDGKVVIEYIGESI